MSTIYYIDDEKDIWCFKNNRAYLYMTSCDETFANYRKWVFRGYSFKQLNKIYKLVPMEEWELIVELL